MPQKIIRLLVKNIKGCRSVEILANPTVNELAGPNEAGKTSILDAINMAFGGKGAFTDKPLRQGAPSGEILAETDKLVVRRDFSEDGSTKLTITSKEGERLGQRGLDELYSSFTFDPLAFTRLKPADQVEAFKNLLPKETLEKLEGIEKEIQIAYQSRRDIGRDIERIGAIQEIPLVAPVNTVDLASQLDEAQKFNQEQDDLLRKMNLIRARGEAAVEEMERIDKLLKNLKDELEALPDLQKKIELAPLVEAMRQAGETNRKAQEYKEYQLRLGEKSALVRKQLEAEEALAKARGRKQDILANNPIAMCEGVEWSDSGLRVAGLPFSELSSSKKLRVSALIGMSTNADLKIMRIQDGSLLDKNSYDELVKLAEERGYQLWIETVGEGHGDAILIENGEKKNGRS